MQVSGIHEEDWIFMQFRGAFWSWADGLEVLSQTLWRPQLPPPYIEPAGGLEMGGRHVDGIPGLDQVHQDMEAVEIFAL